MPCRIRPEAIDDVIAFHGHSCPGLAIGIRAAELALLHFGPTGDEDLVAVTETDMCAVDAIQFFTGCTLGKGNLIVKDHGKVAFTFFNRATGEGFRALFRHESCGDMMNRMKELQARMRENGATHEDEHELFHLREDQQRAYMDLDLEEMFEIQEPQFTLPRGAHILSSLTCAACGERVMESKARLLGGRTLCIPCFMKEDQKI
ncbi:FmdE family protein [Desulfocurvus sp. DL9XJH121]